MADVFDFCGKIALGKETEKFHPVDRKEFQSGWTNTTVKFNLISNTNRILCTSQGGKWVDDKKNIIKTFGRTTTDENGKVVKGDKIEIAWDKRFDEKEIERVAGFRTFKCDTGDIRMRYKLQNVVDGKADIDEELVKDGIDSVDSAKAALQKSNAKKKVFLSEWDFAEHLVKVLESDKFKDKMFYVSGTYDVQYSADKERFYTNYHVNRVTLAPDDAEPSTEFKMDFYYGADSWNDDQYEETGKCSVNGWVSYYDSSLKKNGFMPVSVAVKEDEKKTQYLNGKFNVEDESIKQIGLTLQVLDGAERVEITLDMLDEETQEEISLGLIDFEQYKRELGGSAIGDRVSELRFVGLTPKKNKAQDTMYVMDDMHPAKMEVVEDDPVEDLFGDDDDL